MSTFRSKFPGTIDDPYKRVRYSTGLVLGVDEFEQEQAYFIERDRLLTRALHGYGVVHGLGISTKSSEDELEIRVEPGLAIDPMGQHVCIDREQCATVDDWVARQDLSDLFEDESESTELCVFVVLRYGACETDFVPIPGEPCRSAEETRTASRLTDDFHLTLERARDRPPQMEERAVRVLGRLLRAIETRSDPPHAEAEQVQELVKALPALLSSASIGDGPALPTDRLLPELAAEAGLDGHDAIVFSETADTSLLRIHPHDRTAVLRALQTAWITDARPELLSIGHDDGPLQTADVCSPVPAEDDGVVLGEVCLDVRLNDEGIVERTPDSSARTTTASRPQLVATRLFQEIGNVHGHEPGGDGGGADLGPATDDLAGTYPNLTVARLQGEELSVDPSETDVTLDAGNVLTYGGTRWHPDALALEDLEDVEGVDSPDRFDLLAFDVGENGAWTPTPLSELDLTELDIDPEDHEHPLSALTDVMDPLVPNEDDILQFDGSVWTAEPVPSNAERDLTRIVALSWGHEDLYSAPTVLSLDLNGLDGEFEDRGLPRHFDYARTSEGVPLGVAVAFGTGPLDVGDEQILTTDGSGTVQARTLSRDSFRVYMEADIRGGQFRERRRVVPWRVLPLERVIVEGRVIEGGVVNTDADAARGAVFLFPEGIVGEEAESIVQFDIEVRGGSILDDTEDERAIDGEFVRMELPTGDRPHGTEFGVQGGDFKSSIYFGEANVIDLNSPSLSLDELMELPGIGEAYAEDILEYVEAHGPLNEPEDLATGVSGTGEDTGIRGITEEMIREDWGNRVVARPRG